MDDDEDFDPHFDCPDCHGNATLIGGCPECEDYDYSPDCDTCHGASLQPFVCPSCAGHGTRSWYELTSGDYDTPARLVREYEEKRK
jgi:RecJ-like exonuclease